jgi:hypothetical protein
VRCSSIEPSIALLVVKPLVEVFGGLHGDLTFPDLAGTSGVAVRITPMKGVKSNGMAAASAKTFKRDYVYLNDLPDALTVMSKLPNSLYRAPCRGRHRALGGQRR